MFRFAIVALCVAAVCTTALGVPLSDSASEFGLQRDFVGWPTGETSRGPGGFAPSPGMPPNTQILRPVVPADRALTGIRTETAIVDVATEGYGTTVVNLPLSSPVSLDGAFAVYWDALTTTILPDGDGDKGVEHTSITLSLLAGGTEIAYAGGGWEFWTASSYTTTWRGGAWLPELTDTIDALRITVENTPEGDDRSMIACLGTIHAGNALNVHIVYGPVAPIGLHEVRTLADIPIKSVSGTTTTPWEYHAFDSPVPGTQLKYIRHSGMSWSGTMPAGDDRSTTTESQLVLDSGASIALDDATSPSTGLAPRDSARLTNTSHSLLVDGTAKATLAGRNIVGWRWRVHQSGEGQATITPPATVYFHFFYDHCGTALPDSRCVESPGTRSGPFPPAGLDIFETGASFKILMLDGSQAGVGSWSSGGVTHGEPVVDPATVIGRSDPFFHGDPEEVGAVIFGGGQGAYPDTAAIAGEPCVIPDGYPEQPLWGHEIHTEMLSLDMTNAVGDYVKAGQPFFDSVAGTPQQRFYRNSFGEVQGLANDFPGDSFFNIFVEVYSADLNQKFYNKTPMLVRAEIDQFPPDVGLPRSVYLHDPSFGAVPLFNADGLHVAYLLSAGHGTVDITPPPDACEIQTALSAPVSFCVDNLGSGPAPPLAPNRVMDDEGLPAQQVTVYMSSGAAPGLPPDITNERIDGLTGPVQEPAPPAFAAGDAITSLSYGRDGSRGPVGDPTPAALLFSVGRSTLGETCTAVRLGSESLEPEQAADVYLGRGNPFGSYSGQNQPVVQPFTNSLLADQTVVGLRPLVDGTGQDNLTALEASAYGLDDRLYATFDGELFHCEPGLDCNLNGTADLCDILSGASLDENDNGIPDECEDCNDNGVRDDIDIDLATSDDLNGNGIPDECEDCNDNGIIDEQDIDAGTSQDTNGNGVPDECEDCNENDVLDDEDIASGTSQDCNHNGIPDECDLAAGTSQDADGSGVPDECETAPLPLTSTIFVYDDFGFPELTPFNMANLRRFAGPATLGLLAADTIDALVLSDLTCAGEPPVPSDPPTPNGQLDPGFDEVLFSLHRSSPTLFGPDGEPGVADVDDDGNEVVDDFSETGFGDDWSPATIFHSRFNGRFSVYASGAELGLLPTDDLDALDVGPTLVIRDCNCNDVDDACDIARGYSTDCNANGVPDECERQANDCNCNDTPDECDIASGFSADCQPNGVPDECELDCNENGIPDDCDIAVGTSADCNLNAIPDECDIASGTSLDLNGDGIPDECCDGDMNCDGQVDYTDIDLFVAALSCVGGDPSCWPPEGVSPGCPWLNGDCSGDNDVGYGDIDLFVARIGATCP